jgi:hypothetical protein
LLLAAVGCVPPQEVQAPAVSPPAATMPGQPIAPTASTLQLAAELDAALTAACPVAALDDQQAHQACADALSDLPLLRERMTTTFDWGGQSSVNDVALEDNNRTDFNPRIWRPLYLATYMFPGGHRVEASAKAVVIRVPVMFRNLLDPGAFPYPFWHSAAKWKSYETATEVLFYVREDKLVGGLRSAEQDPTRPRRDMKWDGRWTWKNPQGNDEPRVTLFSYAFSGDNPHVNELDRSYRAMEKELRRENCLSCHSPDNAARMNPLELFSYPNQALSGRKELIQVLDKNTMPPTPEAIPDSHRRVELINLARAFAQAGDLALEYEETQAIGKR